MPDRVLIAEGRILGRGIAIFVLGHGTPALLGEVGDCSLRAHRLTPSPWGHSKELVIFFPAQRPSGLLFPACSRSPLHQHDTAIGFLESRGERACWGAHLGSRAG